MTVLTWFSPLCLAGVCEALLEQASFRKIVPEWRGSETVRSGGVSGCAGLRGVSKGEREGQWGDPQGGVHCGV